VTEDANQVLLMAFLLAALKTFRELASLLQAFSASIWQRVLLGLLSMEGLLN